METTIDHEPVSHVPEWPNPSDILVFGPIEEVHLALAAVASSMAGCEPCTQRSIANVLEYRTALLTLTAMRRAMETGSEPFPIEGERQIIGEVYTEMGVDERRTLAAAEIRRIHEHIMHLAGRTR